MLPMKSGNKNHGLFLLLLTMGWFCWRAVSATRLLVFAGPQQTSETSIEEFFYSFAHGPASPDTNFPNQQAMKDWLWPQIQSSAFEHLTTKPHELFGHLVTDADNEEIQSAILDGIYEHYQAAEATGLLKGVVIGSEQFDFVGPSPFSNYDAVGAVQRVASRLGIDSTNVTVVLLYRLPRLDQWSSLYKKLGTEADDYQAFLCDPEINEIAYLALHNSMSALWVADMYGKAGYSVKLLDLSGLEEAGLDVEHIIGCEYMEAGCDENGYLINLEGNSFLHAGTETDTVVDENVLDLLTGAQKGQLEELFLLRDCAYQKVLDSYSNVKAEFQDQMLRDCLADPFVEPFLSLGQTEFFFNLLQSQVGCNTEDVNLDEIITAGRTPSESINSDTDDDSTVVGAPAESESGGGGGGLMGWKMPVFLLIVFAIGAFAIGWVRGSDQRKLGRYETPEVQVEFSPTSHLSMLT